MQLLYDIGIRLMALCIRIMSIWRAKERDFVQGRRYWQKDLKVKVDPKEKYTWFHAASLGEFEQGRELIESYRAKYPNKKILLSFFSSSGYNICKNTKAADIVCYIPIDYKSNAKAFLDIVDVERAVFIKYEYWFNFIAELKKRNIPINFVASRFRENMYFFKFYGAWALKRLKEAGAVFVQDQLSCNLLKTRGFEDVYLCGDTRFDRVLRLRDEVFADEIIEGFIGDEKNVFVCGSLWNEDIELLRQLIEKRGIEGFKWIMVPHEITQPRLALIEKDYESYCARYSCCSGSVCTAETSGTEGGGARATGCGSSGEIGSERKLGSDKRILIIDKIGMLSRLYRYAKYTYIGGGFGKGIHNTLEAAVYGKPVFFGKKYERFIEAVDLVERGAAFSVKNARELEEKLDRLNQDSQYKIAASSAYDYVNGSRGAVDKILRHMLFALAFLCVSICASGDLEAQASADTVAVSDATVVLHDTPNAHEPAAPASAPDTVQPTHAHHPAVHPTDTAHAPAAPQRRLSKGDSMRLERRSKIAKTSGTTLYYHFKSLNTSIPDLDSLKNTADNFEYYDKSYVYQDFRQTTGEIGRSDHILNYTPQEISGYKYREDVFSSWRYTKENTRFFQSLSPYTELYYVTNFGKNLNMLNVLHTQNFGRGFNVAIDYNVLQAIGLYNNTTAWHHNFRIYTNYFSKDGRYRIEGGFIRNTDRIGENGGIRIDSLFAKNLETNRLRIPVWMPSAAYTRWRENTLFVKQVYHFYADKKDSILENDKSFGFLSHSAELEAYKYAYTDATSLNNLIFENYFLNPSKTSDTTWNMLFRNTFFYGFGDVEQLSGKAINFAIGAKNELVRVKDTISRQVFNTTYAFAKAQLQLFSSFIASAYGDYGFGGYNGGDFSMQAFLKYRFGKVYSPVETQNFASLEKDQKPFSPNSRNIENCDGIRLLAGYRNSAPNYMQTYYFSNHYYFKNNFEKQKEAYAGLDFLYRGWGAKLYAARLDNYVYYSSSPKTNSEGQKFYYGQIQAQQSQKEVYIANALIYKDLNICKYLRLNSLIMLAYSSDMEKYPLPLFSMRESICGYIPINKVSDIQIGLDIYYHTLYNALEYSPALSSFYSRGDLGGDTPGDRSGVNLGSASNASDPSANIQTKPSTAIEVGNYMLADFFLNFKIKRMNIFIKLQNLAQGLLPYNYISTPHYPLHDRCVRIGLLWKFFD